MLDNFHIFLKRPYICDECDLFLEKRNDKSVIMHRNCREGVWVFLNYLKYNPNLYRVSFFGNVEELCASIKKSNVLGVRIGLYPPSSEDEQDSDLEYEDEEEVDDVVISKTNYFAVLNNKYIPNILSLYLA